MRVRCKKCGKLMSRRKNYPFGRESNLRVTYFCNHCNSKSLKGGVE